MILITGGTGLVGGHLTLRLLEKEEQVKLLIRNDESKEKLKKTFSFYSSTPEILLNKIEWAYGDVTDLFTLHDAIRNVDRVYHCAAKVSFDRQHKKEMMDTNIRGAANIVNVCLGFGIKKLLHVSSIAAIKNSAEGEIITENNQWPSGNSLTYAYSKTQAEFEIWRGINEGLQAVIVNPSVILGPGDWSCGSPKFFYVAKRD
jgi:dihydroflavonol-4-reductase